MVGKDPYELYVALCQKTKQYYDPCVLDQFMAAVHFMNGRVRKDWWHFSKERKANFFRVEEKVARYRHTRIVLKKRRRA